ncbi:jg11441 [Pararge aegeria aegeria]|uniref:Jg11441 protein n=1 Tax=Pararge aegeria aegeria TaxID=348720 RepID=A0A8S4S3S5_9NEOP|nr:jg11441 [Pararge aegeria aegeria]
MRNVEAHLLEDKMDEAVTHYINSHQPPESVHVDASSLALNVQEDAGGRVVTLMHPQNFSSQMCRQVSLGDQVGEGTWVEELLDQEGRLAALVAHLSRASHHSHTGHHKVSSLRGDMDASVILDAPMRLFNGQQMVS